MSTATRAPATLTDTDLAELLCDDASMPERAAHAATVALADVHVVSADSINVLEHDPTDSDVERALDAVRVATRQVVAVVALANASRVTPGLLLALEREAEREARFAVERELVRLFGDSPVIDVQAAASVYAYPEIPCGFCVGAATGCSGCSGTGHAMPF